MTPILTILALGVPITVIALTLRALYNVLVPPQWTPEESRWVLRRSAVILGVWFLLAALSAWLGAYRAVQTDIRTIQYPLLVPILIGVWAMWRSPTLMRIVDALPQQWLVSMQAFRVLGGVFLILYAMGKMPGVFAWPAGIGDMLVGALAPTERRLVFWWNILGVTDLVVAVATGVASAPSLIQMTAFDRPNEMIAAFPVVMVPAFLVPLWILMHIASLTKLRRAAALDQASGGVAVSPM